MVPVRNDKGFTLLELLIVIVILGVLAGLAIPAYQGSVEKARSQEALASLGAARESALRFFALNGSYTAPATICFSSIAGCAPAGALDFDPNPVSGGATPIFSYAIGGVGAAAFTITATRLGGPVGTVSINQAGTVVKGGVYA